MLLKPPKGVLIERGDNFSRGLVGFWAMNEGSGNKVFDLSGNNVPGTLQNEAAFCAANDGPGLRFDGVDDALFCPVRTSAISGYPFTMLVTTRQPVNDGTARAVMAIANGGGAVSYACIGYRQLTGTRRFFIGLRSAGDGELTEYIGLSNDANWHQLALVLHASANADAYYDGNYLGNDADVVTLDFDFTRVAFACSGDSSPSYYYAGDISYSGLWNRALTAGEILRLYRDMFR